MNKDVIYIDVDDDVTAIIGKIKAAKEKIIALVPPKHAGALQSAVNLRLLDRMAHTEHKKLVLITNNQALIALAANAKIPVAKNLQSKPEIADIPALIVDDGDDVIDGSELPIGEHAATIPIRDGSKEPLRGDIIETIDIEKDLPVTSRSAGGAKAAKNPKKKTKIPDFNSFRKKIIWGAVGAVSLIALLIWMFVIAPAATVIITARTTPAPVSTAANLSTTAVTDGGTSTLHVVQQQQKVDETLAFDATGTGKVGEKATGTMTLTRTSVSSTAIAVPAGTRFTSDGLSFLSTEGTSLAGTTIGPSGIVQDQATVAVEAEEVGAEYNLSARSYQASVGGFSSTGSNMAGGSSREVKVVSEADVERAQGELIGKSTEAAKKSLVEKFKNGEKLIDSSFTVERGKAISSPAVGEEAEGGKATLQIPTTYTIYAVLQADLEKYLDGILKGQLVRDNQKIYDNGFDSAELSNFLKDGEVLTATLTATGQIGPKIDETAIKEQVKGQRYGEVQSSLEAVEGIQEVDVKFSFPWVLSVPQNTDKIDIEFKVENE